MKETTKEQTVEGDTKQLSLYTTVVGGVHGRVITPDTVNDIKS